METWFIIFITLCISVFLKSIFTFLSPSTTIKPKLPPGPPTVPILGNFLLLRKSFSELESVLRNLHAKYGPVVTLMIGSRPAIFVSDRSLAHQALIQNGAVFSDRPRALPTNIVFSSNQHNISSAGYGSTWRLLRRNLTSEILHPSRIRSYSPARKWVLEILINRLESRSNSGEAAVDVPVRVRVRVVDHFQYAMFCLLVFMCFGNKVNEKQLNDIEHIQRKMLLSLRRFRILNFWPKIGKIIFRNRWNELFELRKNQEDILIPLIRARKQLMTERLSETREDHKLEEHDDRDQFVLSYVDTLLNLQLPDEKRKLNEEEIVTLCSEFLNAGTDTTSTALQWIMANIVKYPHVQNKLVEEINGIVRPEAEEVEEEDLQKMPYLKAVILEGLRRHPPGHLVLPHSVTEDTTLNGHLIPKNSSLNFMVAEMGWDPKVWEDPMQFKPERFLSCTGAGNDGGSNSNGGVNAGEVFDITSSREIKMMPFGAGRRICPGSGLAMLHLEYFVANLVRYFKWTANGDVVDMSEKQEFTTVMKNPLQACLFPRKLEESEYTAWNHEFHKAKTSNGADREAML